VDTVSFRNIGVGVRVSLATTSRQRTNAGYDKITTFDNVVGTARADVLTGNTIANQLYGDAGGDKLYGGSGADKLYGGTGTDYGDGGYGRDSASSVERRVRIP